MLWPEDQDQDPDSDCIKLSSGDQDDEENEKNNDHDNDHKSVGNISKGENEEQLQHVDQEQPAPPEMLTPPTTKTQSRRVLHLPQYIVENYNLGEENEEAATT
eukprot:4583314-Ditylum_brightwellii.AAC.1